MWRPPKPEMYVTSEKERYVLVRMMTGEAINVIFEFPLCCAVVFLRNFRQFLTLLYLEMMNEVFPNQEQKERRDQERTWHEPKKDDYDPYAVLEVPKTATLEECRKAYRLLSRKHHPDKNLDNVEEAAKKMTELNAAMNTIQRKLADDAESSDDDEEAEEYEEAPQKNSDDDDDDGWEERRKQQAAYREEMERRRQEAAQKQPQQGKGRARNRKKKDKKKQKKQKKTTAPAEKKTDEEETKDEEPQMEAASELGRQRKEAEEKREDQCTHPVVVAMAVGARGMFFEKFMDMVRVSMRNGDVVGSLTEALDDDGNTVLHFAAVYNARYVVDFIVHLAGDLWPYIVMARNRKGQRPVDMCPADDDQSAAARLKDLTDAEEKNRQKRQTIVVDWIHLRRRCLQLLGPALVVGTPSFIVLWPRGVVSLLAWAVAVLVVSYMAKSAPLQLVFMALTTSWPLIVLRHTSLSRWFYYVGALIYGYFTATFLERGSRGPFDTRIDILTQRVYQFPTQYALAYNVFGLHTDVADFLVSLARDAAPRLLPRWWSSSNDLLDLTASALVALGLFLCLYVGPTLVLLWRDPSPDEVKVDL